MYLMEDKSGNVFQDWKFNAPENKKKIEKVQLDDDLALEKTVTSVRNHETER